jgi:hypothetical protein
MRGRWPRALTLVLAVAFVACATPGSAQQIRLALTGWPLTVTTTDGGAFEQGFVSLGSTTYSVEVLSNGPNKSTSVQVQCATVCPRSGTIPLSGLQWNRADQPGVWNTLTTAYVTIETQNVVNGGANDPWSNTLNWRYVLSWTGNPPAAVTQYRVRFRLLVANP